MKDRQSGLFFFGPVVLLNQKLSLQTGLNCITALTKD